MVPAEVPLRHFAGLTVGLHRRTIQPLAFPISLALVLLSKRLCDDTAYNFAPLRTQHSR
jgi:hypothetical protein